MQRPLPSGLLLPAGKHVPRLALVEPVGDEDLSAGKVQQQAWRQKPIRLPRLHHRLPVPCRERRTPWRKNVALEEELKRAINIGSFMK